jgi:methionyl-tRNA formyltransferase
MHKNDKLNVVLFALTGFGNPVLKALLAEARANLVAVFTVKYDNPFPYYPEQHLLELCAERGVTSYHGLKVGSAEGLALLAGLAPDLILMATFKQILSAAVLKLPRLGVVNLHPSLLPRYRGPCPTNAALLNDEAVSGVTAHYVSEAVDEGNILLQRSLSISGITNDGALRHDLARLAGEMIPDLIEMFAGGGKPPGQVQDHRLASLAPKPAAEAGELDPARDDIDTIRRKMRAFNPLPGTTLRLGQRRVAVDRFELMADNRSDGWYEQEPAIDMVVASQAIRLFKKPD